MAYRNPAEGKRRERERYHKRVAARREHGLCPRCGRLPPEPGRSRCAPCAEKHRIDGRARDARLRAAGIQRRDPIRAKANERDRARRRTAERAAQGLCTKCGRNPPEPDRRTCEPCAVKRRKAERERYHRARSAGKKYGGRPVEGQTAQRPHRRQQAAEGPPRGEPLHPVRTPASGRRAGPPASPVSSRDVRWTRNSTPPGALPGCA